MYQYCLYFLSFKIFFFSFDGRLGGLAGDSENKPEMPPALPQSSAQNASSEDQLDSSDLAVLSAAHKWLEEIKKESSKTPKKSPSKPDLVLGNEGDGYCNHTALMLYGIR